MTEAANATDARQTLGEEEYSGLVRFMKAHLPEGWKVTGLRLTSVRKERRRTVASGFVKMLSLPGEQRSVFDCTAQLAGDGRIRSLTVNGKRIFRDDDNVGVRARTTVTRVRR